MQALRKLFPRIERTLLYRHNLLEAPQLDATTSVRIEQLPIFRLSLLQRVGPVSVREARSRVDRGDSCYVAFVDGEKPASYCWVQRTGRHYIQPAGIRSEVTEGQAWVYDCWTAEWARGKRIYPLVLARIVSDFRSKGGRSLTIYTTESNVRSQGGITRAGFRLVTRIVSVRVGPMAALISHSPVQSGAELDC